MKKWVIVTGATRGLGLAMAKRLLDENWSVEAWDLKAECEFQHPDFHVRAVDVSSEESVKVACENLLKEGITPHALVNNAGITRDVLLHKMQTADFEATWKVNVLGTFLPTQIIGSAMREANSLAQKKGLPVEPRRIIMISSVAGIFGNIGQANYAATKAAVIGFMKSTAKEWGRFGISSVAVAPGLMKTAMTQTIPEDVIAGFIERTPLKRMGEPDELAAFVAFLCRPEASFINGEVISFSGGLLL